MLGVLLSLLISGLIIGALARFALPGRDPLRIWQTILLGIAGSIVGGVIAGLLGAIDGDETISPGEAGTSFVASLLGAILLLFLYRRFVLKRPLTGPDAR